MTCEEFELAGLDLETIQEDDSAHSAAREHLTFVPALCGIARELADFAARFARGGRGNAESGSSSARRDAAAARIPGAAQDREGAAGCRVCGLDTGGSRSGIGGGQLGELAARE